MGPPSTQSRWVDWNAVFNSVGDDIEALRELAMLFQDAMPRHVAAMKNAITRDDWAAVAREAHSVKGQVGFFTNDEPYLVARQAVNTARVGEEESCRRACQRLESLLDRLIEEIRGRLD